MANTISIYGVVFEHWNFFMVIYLYWYAEVISTIFDLIKLKTARRQQGDKMKHYKESFDMRKTNFFFLGVYWVFIIVLLAVVMSTKEQWIDNFRVIFFMDLIFNINLFVIVTMQLRNYIYEFIIRKDYNMEALKAEVTMIGRRSMVLHISIIFGTFAWFASNSDKFFFKINLGPYSDYAFAGVFMIIKIISDIYSLTHNQKASTAEIDM
jgi:hypothetical protein